MPFSFRVLLEEAQVGTPVVQPCVVTRRLIHESGLVEQGTPILWIRLGAEEYELRVRFRCFIGIRVDVGQSLQPGALLASGGADGENLPTGFRYLSAYQVGGVPKNA